MRFVQKTDSPESFETWKILDPQVGPKSYSDLRNPEKRHLHESLVAEQGGTCCYCGDEIHVDTSHIEHFEPQESARERDLDYRNLFASCIRAQRKSVPLHCGHAKGRDFDAEFAISPLNEDCERRFLFRTDGEVHAVQQVDKSADYMIDLLKLNVPALCNRRQEALDGIFDSELLATITIEEFALIRDRHLSRQSDGLFAAFSHVIVNYAQQWLDALDKPAETKLGS